MEFKIEEESPVKKTILVTVEPEEVDAALAGAVALYKDSVQMDGFRKGKVPVSIIEKKFHDKIYEEARENLINVHINDILSKLDVTPVSGIKMNEEDNKLEKGKGFSYTLEFEVMPKFDLPSYEGLKVEEEKSELDPKELAMVFERMRSENAKLQVVESNGPAQDGQIAVIDFEAFEDDKPLKDFRAMNFYLELGDEQALPDFEKMVKGIPVGHTAEEIIKFPEDFLAENLAGKDIKFKVTVHGIKEKIIPDLDDNFAKNIGFQSLDQLRELVEKSYLKNVKDMNKGVAQRKLLDQMLKQTDFELPPAMIETETTFLLANENERLERHGKSLKSLGKSPEELKKSVQPQAEKMVRDKILLLNIAKKENLDVTPEELQKNVYRDCIIHGDDFQEVIKNLEKSGLIFHLRDQMICDKAMDLVYDRADITTVEPSPHKDLSQETASSGEIISPAPTSSES